MKRVLFLADVPGWVFDSHRKEIAKRLAPEYEVSCVYRDVGFPAREFYDDFDCVYVMDTRLMERKPQVPPEKTCVGVRCEFSWAQEGAATHYDRLVKGKARVLHVVCKKHLEEFSRVDPKTVLVQHGIDLAAFNCWDRTWNSDKLVVGVAGNPKSGGEKGFDLVKRACDSIGAELVTASGLSKAEMPGFYRSLDAFCCASASEGQNNPTMEAMACGVPVVSTRAGAAEEMVGPEFLVDRAPAAFAHKLSVLKALKGEERAKLGFLTSKKMEAWSWDARAPGFKEMFEKIMNGER